MGQTNQRGTVLGGRARGRDSLPRSGRRGARAPRMAEQRKGLAYESLSLPPPVGRPCGCACSPSACADLRGPTACEILTPDEVQAGIEKLGPDPLLDPAEGGGPLPRSVRKKPTPIGLLLMDQTVVAASATCTAPRYSSGRG